MKLNKSRSALFFSLCISASAVCAEGEGAQTQTPASDNQQTAAAAPAAASSSGSVARAAFSTGIQDREPVDQISKLDTADDTVYFFTELKDLQDQTVIHRWEHNGEALADVSFDVGGSRWRVWSSKKLQDDWTGTWKVSVINGAGEIIETQQFTYEKAAAASGSAAGIADTTDKKEMKSEPAITE